MKAQEELPKLDSSLKTVLTLGVFDGVHLGHVYLLNTLIDYSKELGCSSGVVTFRNHPVSVLNPSKLVSSICSLEERVKLIQGLGINFVFPITFDTQLAELKAKEFVILLKEKLGMVGLLIGPDFALGHKREGNLTTLLSLGSQFGFTVKTVDPLQKGGKKVGSATIRQAVEEGNIDKAPSLLGRRFSLMGSVVKGDSRGTELGYPTTNLRVSLGQLVPRNGIYATWVLVNGHRYQSATSIGVRPTFGGGDRTIETFIFDFNDNLYNKEIQIEFAKRLRDELFFESQELLVEQIGRDVDQAKEVLSRYDGDSN
jgi:riboflavin kinase/FMN adenylyltransferase